MENYVTILEESLIKKMNVLEKIQAYNEAQKSMFMMEEISFEMFDKAVEEKGNLIQQLNILDRGFETLYANVSKELAENKDIYKEQIQHMQELIVKITDMSVAIESQESRNKNLIEQYFNKERTTVKQGRKSSKAALDYYKNMSKSNEVPPQFLDSKK